MAAPSELDKLRAKTAKTPEDFRLLAQAQGVIEPEELRYWLQTECGLAGEYARRIAQLLRQLDGLPLSCAGESCSSESCSSESSAGEGRAGQTLAGGAALAAGSDSD